MKETKANFYLDLRPLPRNTLGQTSIEYLLIQLQHGARTASEQQPKRVFDIHGDELKTIGQLKSLQHVFLSFGEDFQKPFRKIFRNENPRIFFIENFRSGAGDRDPERRCLPTNERSSALANRSARRRFDERTRNPIGKVKTRARHSLFIVRVQKRRFDLATRSFASGRP